MGWISAATGPLGHALGQSTTWQLYATVCCHHVSPVVLNSDPTEFRRPKWGGDELGLWPPTTYPGQSPRRQAKPPPAFLPVFFLHVSFP